MSDTYLERIACALEGVEKSLEWIARALEQRPQSGQLPNWQFTPYQNPQAPPVPVPYPYQPWGGYSAAPNTLGGALTTKHIHSLPYFQNLGPNSQQEQASAVDSNSF